MTCPRETAFCECAFEAIQNGGASNDEKQKKEIAFEGTQEDRGTEELGPIGVSGLCHVDSDLGNQHSHHNHSYG